MADLLSIMSAAQTSLAAQRGLTATASHNIDNANNPNYARQIATIEAVVPADQTSGVFIGQGATLTSVTQARDRFLESQLPGAISSAASSTAESDALQAFHGLDPGASGNLGDAISGFYSSLTALAQNPNDTGLRTAALGSARQMARSFNSTAQQIEAARAGLDAQASGLAVTINSEASAVAQLNAQIASLGSAGGTPNDLLDLRQQHLDKLAELAGATAVPTSSGAVDVVLPGGAALVAGSRAAQLSTQPDVNNGGHVQVLITAPDGSAPRPVANASLGGTLGGTLAARDGALKTAAADVDQLAYDLAGKINGVLVAGSTSGGSAGTPLFDAGAGVAGAAGHLSVLISDPTQLATVAPPDPTDPNADTNNVNALVQTQSAPLTGGSGAQSALSAIVSKFGASSTTAKAFADQGSALRDQLTQLRASYSGVSIDDEMITLQTAQRGYQAIAKVIQTADQMMQTLIAMIPS